MTTDANREKIMLLCKSIEQKKGSSAIYTLDSAKSNANIKRWSTGIEDLDGILGGGMPCGRIVEIYGPESSGKTSLALHLTSMHDLALYQAAEGTFDSERAKIFGNRKKQLIVSRPEWGEDAVQEMMDFAKAGIPVIVTDSLPFLVPKAEFEQIEKDINKEQRIGGVARLMTKAMPGLTKAIEKSGTTIIIINQVRDNMQAMMFGEKTQTMGGHALKHGYSVRIQIARRDWIDVPNRDSCNSAEKKKIGIISKVKITKSKVCNPFGEALLPMMFDKGFVSYDDVEDIRKEIMRDSRKKRTRNSED